MLLDDSDVVPALEEFQTARAAEDSSTLVIYVSQPAAFAQLPQVYQKLSKRIGDNVGQYGGVFVCRDSAEDPPEELNISDSLAVKKWKGWLLDGDEALIREDIARFLQKKDEAKKLDKRTLVVIAQLIVSTLYSFEPRSTEKMMAAPQTLDSFAHAADSAQALLAFLDEVILQYQGRMTLNQRDGNTALLKQIKNYVGSHLESPLNREEIAEKFFISKDYLSHLFTKNEGMGFTQYVNDQRINKAKELLRNTTLPIKIIALNVGIPDYAYFSKMFRKSTGVSANEYRARHQGGK